jgi:hypothetical protein
MILNSKKGADPVTELAKYFTTEKGKAALAKVESSK